MQSIFLLADAAKLHKDPPKPKAPKAPKDSATEAKPALGAAKDNDSNSGSESKSFLGGLANRLRFGHQKGEDTSNRRTEQREGGRPN